MTLRRRSRRRRARRATSSAFKTIRSIALVRALLAAVRRRRALELALRGGPAALAAALVVAVLARRRRRARLQAELGPPNQSAPGHHAPPAQPIAVPGDPDAAQEPNQGATAAEPAATA